MNLMRDPEALICEKFKLTEAQRIEAIRNKIVDRTFARRVQVSII